jgi:hypothetical protein
MLAVLVDVVVIDWLPPPRHPPVGGRGRRLRSIAAAPF